ncbi:hypothetical protein ES705_05083 [subsurface metagenome]
MKRLYHVIPHTPGHQYVNNLEVANFGLLIVYKIENAQMIRNYILSAFRNFTRNKVYSVIYLIGLAFGITSCLIIFLFVENELKFDRIHPDFERSYRVTHLFKMPQWDDFTAYTQYPMADAIRETISGYEQVVRVLYFEELEINIDNEVIRQNDLIFTEPEFFDMFQYDWVAGNQANALRDVNTIIVTEDFAQKHFQSTSVLGNSLILLDSVRFTITGVLKNPGKHTHLPYSALLSVNSLTTDFIGFDYDQWRATLSGFFTYVKLHPKTEPRLFENQFEILKEKYLREEDREMEYFFLQPLNKIHLDNTYTVDNPGYTTSKEFIVIISLVGILILIVASINVINLRTAHAMKRSREVGIRKVTGASRFDLIHQFMFENLILVLMAIFASLFMAEVVLNLVNQLFEGTILLELYASYSMIVFIAFSVLIVTVLTGLYPVALALITVSMTISYQLHFMINKDMGFRKNEIVSFPLPESDPVILNRLRVTLNQKPYITQTSFSNGAPASPYRIGSFFSYPGAPEGERYQFNLKYVDTNYLGLFDLDILAGSWFHKQSYVDMQTRIVVNEALIKRMGIPDPDAAVGKFITRGSENQEIIGVVKDFHIEPLYSQIKPVVMAVEPDEYYFLNVHYLKGREDDLLEECKTIWQEFFPNDLYSYEFLDDFIGSFYSKEHVTGKLTRWFSLIVLIITCLGILGLVLFMTTIRLKEFGIRKVLGITKSGIIGLVAKEYFILIMLAFLIACPASWLIIQKWMQNFAFRASITYWIFLLPLAGILFISMIPVILTTVRAANTTPALCLRHE